MRFPRRAVSSIIEVDRDDFTVSLYLYELAAETHVLKRSWPCAIGTPEYRTPAGRFLVTGRSDEPTWTVPNSDWAPPELRGVKIPFNDPRNPIKARWIGFHKGVGFHGTDNLDSIGTLASHGCVRMRVQDVIELYPFTREWRTVVRVFDQPREYKTKGTTK